MENYGDSAKLEAHKAQLQILVESEKALVEFSKMILRGTFLLNGAAAIAIIPTWKAALCVAMLWFAIGAMLAAMGSGVAYCAQFFATITWSKVLHENPFIVVDASAEEKINNAKSKRAWYVTLQVVAIALVILSLACFCTGLYEAFDVMVK
ncbi:MAG: hypothetical protein IJU79_05490 [Desulfovibrionaceae bacterium]|nr:hypothetical protein [Desulfovibrionaceae bacterium]